jgi:acyl dehydratase
MTDAPTTEPATIDVGALAVGDRVPAFRRTAGFHNWNRYAAVNSEFVDIHMDDDAGRAAGFPGAVGMGNLTLAWLHAMFRAWLGDQGRLLSLSAQFRAPALKGDTVTCSAVVTAVAVTEEGTRVDLDILAENQRGEAVMPGTATVLVPPPA